MLQCGSRLQLSAWLPQAAREFAEETLGIIGGEGMHLQTRISQSAAKVNKVLADQNPESMVVTIRGVSLLCEGPMCASSAAVYD